MITLHSLPEELERNKWQGWIGGGSGISWEDFNPTITRLYNIEFETTAFDIDAFTRTTMNGWGNPINEVRETILEFTVPMAEGADDLRT